MLNGLDSNAPISELAVDGIDFDIISLRRIFSLPKIQALSMRRCKIDEKDFVDLVSSPSLRRLDLSGASLSSDVVEEFTKKHPKIFVKNVSINDHESFNRSILDQGID